MDFLESGLLGEANIISNTYVPGDWGTIICDRKTKNQIVKDVGGSFSLLKHPQGKTIILNNETVMDVKHAVPHLYKNKNNITRINALHMQNIYCEGIAVGFNVCNHL